MYGEKRIEENSGITCWFSRSCSWFRRVVKKGVG